MIRREDNGLTSTSVIEDTGGPMGYGWGASRALPAARWRQIPRPEPVMLAGGSGSSIGHIRVPNGGKDTKPWQVDFSQQTPIDAAVGGEGTGTTTSADQTMMSFFSDLFSKAFGTTANKSMPDSGAVVVYGDSSTGSAAPQAGPIIIIILLAVVGYFAYKRFA